jgi:DNA ligase-1
MLSFKPMLAPHEIPDFDTLRYPLLASTKFDGFRCMSQDGLKSRTLKPIVNQFLQERFKGLPWGVDGELIQGLKQDNETFKRTSRIAVKKDRPLDFFGDTVRLRVFDKFDPTAPFDQRLAAATEACKGHEFAVPVPHEVIANVSDLEAFEAQSLEQGYEGVMLRSLSGPYKQGRATLKQGWLMKVKRFEDAEATIIEAYEENENQNEEFTNELGRMARSSCKAGKVGKGQLGGFRCVGYNGHYQGVEFDVSSSAIDHDDRKTMWTGRDTLKGLVLTYKFFPKGSDTKPRHPIFKGMRSLEDL